ncbi:uncharacterized protein LOC111939931 isoform X2 [Cyanistes caeruleus]|uniref:uncharacterized protein LOC111939931 isoform X2 n=1 Tax=Cyanistes caeruleus TaxID=156563 RepID=UPI000CDA89E8|nr:uncharacterized protein LOC111939931 isoform X2 [Cyanistes caeruleus]XP_023798186.1 uncharacterized protein LOC111939931 isoform X2 [Cyanistes caeruleus]XP_023798187.1 uncharacterized protein LOC111939931 isoform X2 [Cyanistes caeruleus]
MTELELTGLAKGMQRGADTASRQNRSCECWMRHFFLLLRALPGTAMAGITMPPVFPCKPPEETFAVIELQNGLCWKGPQSPSHPTSYHGQRHLPPDLVALSPIQPGLGHFQGWGNQPQPLSFPNGCLLTVIFTEITDQCPSSPSFWQDQIPRENLLKNPLQPGMFSKTSLEDWGTSTSEHSGKAALVFCSPRALLLDVQQLILCCSHILPDAHLLHTELWSSPPSSSEKQLRATLPDEVSFPRCQNCTSHQTWQLVPLWHREGRNQQVSTVFLAVSRNFRAAFKDSTCCQQSRGHSSERGCTALHSPAWYNTSNCAVPEHLRLGSLEQQRSLRLVEYPNCIFPSISVLPQGLEIY